MAYQRHDENNNIVAGGLLAQNGWVAKLVNNDPRDPQPAYVIITDSYGNQYKNWNGDYTKHDLSNLPLIVGYNLGGYGWWCKILTPTDNYVFSLRTGNALFGEINWGDGTTEDDETSRNGLYHDHTFATAGEYYITLTDVTTTVRFSGVNDTTEEKSVFLEIGDVGSTEYTSTSGAQFGHMNNLVTLGNVSYAGTTSPSGQHAFRGLHSLTSLGTIESDRFTNASSCFMDMRSIVTFPSMTFPMSTSFAFAWYGCTLLENFPTNVFDSTGTLIAGAFSSCFFGCALTPQSIENILVSLDTNGASGIDLDIDGGTNAGYSTWTSAAQSALTNLQGKSWTVSYNA